MVIDGRDTSSIMVWVLTAGNAARMLAIAGETAVAARSSSEIDKTAILRIVLFMDLTFFA